MEDDLIAGLTRQVKEEVIENYLTERLLLDLQTEDLLKQAKESRSLALKTGRRLTRLAFLVIHPEMQERLLQLLRIPADSFWNACIGEQFTRGVRFIRVKAFTDKAKFRKLFLESYARLYKRMETYRKSYHGLKSECQAVNDNIRRFQKNFDLLAILSFLRSLDTVTLERKLFLGENFTSEELGSIDQKLHVHPVVFEKLDVPPPLELPKPERIEEPLGELAAEVYRRFQMQVKRIMQ